MTVRMKFSQILASLCALLSLSTAMAQVPSTKCTAVDSATNISVAEYVTAKYHLSSVSQLSLKKTGEPNADCYTEFEYEVLSSHRSITLYLTPDHKYLVPALYNRATDPLAEERQQRADSLRALTAGRAASEGPKSAQVTLVEFSDFQCPYCQRLTAMLEKDVLPDNLDVRLVFRNFPLPMHPWAKSAAQIAACGQMQSDAAFWKLHDYIFSNQKEFTAANVTEKLLAVADNEPSLNKDAFHECVDQDMTMGPVQKDVDLGKKFGVNATPTLFVNGTKIEGVRDAAQLKQLIAQAKSGQLPASEVASAEAGTARPAAAVGNACIPAK